MIFLFDLDGTIAFKGEGIEGTIVQSIKDLEARGHHVIFASARPIRDMLPLLTDDFKDNFYIGGNGSIVKRNQNIETSLKIDHSSAVYLKCLIEEYNLDYLVDDEWNYSLKNFNDKESQINDKIDVLKLAKNISINDIQEPIKFVLMNIPSNRFDNIYQDISRLPVEIVKHEGTSSIDITAQNVNKYTTFRSYFPGERYIAFGNDENDLTMLKNAESAIVVGDSLLIENRAYERIPAVSREVADTIAKYGKIIESRILD